MSAARISRHPRATVVLSAAAALIALAVLAPAGSAATLSREQASQIYSTGVSNGSIYWFQREVRSSGRRGSRRNYNGRILSRTLGSGKVKVAYAPPAGTQILGFNARGGRLAVGLSSTRSEKGRSAVYELTPETTGLVPKLIAERLGATAADTCGQKVLLTNIDHLGRMVIEDVSYSGAQGKCNIVRRIGQFKRINADGTTTDLKSRDYGWANFNRRDEVPDLQTGPGDWVVAVGSAFSIFEGMDSYANLESGKRVHLPQSEESPETIEFSATDVSLVNFSYEYSTRPDFKIVQSPADFGVPIPLKRAGSVSWFHICGGQLLEISRRKATRRKAAGSRWNLYLRDMNGNVTRRLKERVTRASAFDACDAKVAVFHTRYRRGKARQFTVPLG